MIIKMHNQYFRFILGVLGLSALLITFIVLYIINVTFAHEEETQYQKAFEWQMKHRGVVGITDSISETYKQKFTDFMVERNKYDTLLFGSSTVMAIATPLLPKHKIFNAAKNSNPLYDSISKAQYYIAKNENIKYVVIGFDWALGKPYQKYIKSQYEPLETKRNEIALSAKIKDAVSYQRVKVVVDNLYEKWFKRPEVYQCPNEDTIGTDAFFTPLVPRYCHGFRIDGSAVFTNKKNLNEKEAENILNAGLVEYRKMISDSKGVIEPGYLEDIQKMDEVLKQRGGKIMILIPPLIPGGAELIEKSEDAPYLKRTMDRLTEFTAQHKIELLDASKSEKFGCKSAEFIDAHHAFPSCFEKILPSLLF
jgi:hypothetical protein